MFTIVGAPLPVSISQLGPTSAAAFATLFVLTAFSVAQTTPPPVGTSNVEQHDVAPNSAQQEYLISPDDLLDLYIVDVPELSRTYRVSPTGQVTLPLLSHPLNVAGLTLGQFADLTTQELRAQGLVSDPRVTVNVKESREHSVTVSGAVKKPQIYFV